MAQDRDFIGASEVPPLLAFLLLEYLPIDWVLTRAQLLIMVFLFILNYLVGTRHKVSTEKVLHSFVCIVAFRRFGGLEVAGADHQIDRHCIN